MELTTTAKIQVVVDSGQKKLLDETLETYREACNYVSEHIFKTHNLKQASLNEELYYSLREKYGLKSQMAQSVLKTVIARYKAILENEGEWIKPVFKKPQLDLVWNRDYSLTKGFFSVNTLQGRVRLPYFSKGMEKHFSDAYKFGTAKLVSKYGKFFLHIPVTEEVDEVDFTDICHVVGIDRGVNFITATYNSKGKCTFLSGREAKQKRAHYKKLRADLQRKGTPSSRRRLKRIGDRENRWMQDVNHCASKALVQQNPKRTLFVLEDLEGVREVTEKVRRKDRYVTVSWAFYDLEQKLIYKAQKNSSMVVKVDPAYTSQTCPKCGHTARTNRDKKKHLFKCKNCGYNSNDDRIGAMNLYRKGIDYLIEKQKKDTVVEE